MFLIPDTCSSIFPINSRTITHSNQGYSSVEAVLPRSSSEGNLSLLRSGHPLNRSQTPRLEPDSHTLIIPGGMSL